MSREPGAVQDRQAEAKRKQQDRLLRPLQRAPARSIVAPHLALLARPTSVSTQFFSKRPQCPFSLGKALLNPLFPFRSPRTHPTAVATEPVPPPPCDRCAAQSAGTPLRTRRSGCVTRSRADWSDWSLSSVVSALELRSTSRVLSLVHHGHRLRHHLPTVLLTSRGVKLGGRAACLSSRRSSFRRFPSGEAQYFAGVSHPATPASFRFLTCMLFTRSRCSSSSRPSFLFP